MLSVPFTTKVLIAPALREDEISGLREEIKSLPTLFFWAEDDTTVPYERKKQLLDHFLSKEVVVFDGVLSEEKEEWQAHLPENIKACLLPLNTLSVDIIQNGFLSCR